MSLRSNCKVTLDLISNASACVRTLRADQASPSGQLDYELAVGALYCLGQQAGASVDLTKPDFNSAATLSRLGENSRLRWMECQVEYSRIHMEIAIRSQLYGKRPESDNHVLENSLNI